MNLIILSLEIITVAFIVKALFKKIDNIPNALDLHLQKLSDQEFKDEQHTIEAKAIESQIKTDEAVFDAYEKWRMNVNKDLLERITEITIKSIQEFPEDFSIEPSDLKKTAKDYSRYIKDCELYKPNCVNLNPYEFAYSLVQDQQIEIPSFSPVYYVFHFETAKYYSDYIGKLRKEFNDKHKAN